MKFLILFAALIALSSAMGVRRDAALWEKIPEVKNATQCIFLKEKSLLSCRGVSGVVDCDAVLEVSRLNISFDVFGIAKDSIMLDDAKVYELYPRRLSNSSMVYMNNSVIVDGKEEKIVLYAASSSSRSGIRVVDSSCFDRVVVQLEKIVDSHAIELESSLEVKPKVQVIGEILVADKSKQRRFLFGLGLGLGWGFPFGFGLGLGFPFFG